MAKAVLDIELNPTLNEAKYNAIVAAIKGSLGALSDSVQPIDPKSLAAIEATDAATKALQRDLAEAGVAAVAAGDKLVDAGGRASKAFAANQFAEQAQRVASALSGIQAPFLALDAQVQNIGTLGVKNFQEFTDLALDLSESVPDSAANIAQGVYNAVSAGVTGTNQDIIGFAETASKAAVAGISDTNTAVNAGTSVLNAYKLTAADSQQVFDTFFAGIKLGKTSFAEMSAGLANVIPAASAAGIQFDEVTASIAQMTALGVPTAQSTTQIRSAIVELQKPGSDLAKVMAGVGLSAANMGQTLKEQGLIATLQQVEQSASSMGLSLTQVFSSSEAASAALLLTGENAARANEVFQQVQQEVAGGAATQAYAVAAESASVKTQVLINNVEAVFTRGFAAIGSTANVVIGSVNQLGPTFTSLAGLKDILPTESLSKFGSGVKDVVLPALVKLGVLRATGVATIAAETTAETANTASKALQATVTTTATGAQYALNTAMLANPVFLLVAGVAGLAAGIAIFSKGTKDLGEATTDANKALEEFDQRSQVAEGAQRQQSALQDLAAEYDRLKDATDPQSQQRFAEVSEQLAQKVPDAAVAVDQLDGSGRKVGETFEISTESVRHFADEQVRIAELAKAEALANLDDQTAALAASMQEAIAKQKELREEHAAYQAQVEAGAGDLASQQVLGSPFDTIRDDLTDVNRELAQQHEEIAKAEPTLRKNIALYREQGLSVEEIAARLNTTTDLVVKYDGEISAAKVGVANLEAAITGLSEPQQQQIRQISEQVVQYQTAQQAVEKLKQQIAGKQTLGIDTTDLEQQLADAQKTASEKDLKVRATIEAAGGFEKVFADIPEAVRGQLGKVPEIVRESGKRAAAEARAAKVGEALTEAAQIKGKLDSENRIGELLTSLAAARTQAERDSLAAQIARDVPQAIVGMREVENAQGGITTQYEINADKARQWIDTQTQQLTGKLLPQNRALIDTLGDQVGKYNEGRTALGRMADEIVRQGAAGKNVTELQARYDALKAEVEASAGEIANTVKQGQKYGLLQGDVQKMAEGFGKGADEAASIATAVQRIPAEVAAAVASIPDLAKRFTETFAELKKKRDELVAGAAATAQEGGDTSDIQRQIAETDRQIREQQGLLDTFDPEKQRAERERAQKEFERLQKEREAKLAALSAFELKLQEDTQKSISALEVGAIDDRRDKALRAIAVERDERLRAIDKEFASATEKFGETAQITASLGAIGTDELQRQARALVALDDETFRQRIASLDTNTNKRLLIYVESLVKERTAVTEANAALLKDLVDLDKERLSQASASAKALVDTVSDATSQGIRRRAAASADALQLETRGQLETILASDKDFVERFGAIAELPTQQRAAALQRLIDDAIAQAEPGGPVARAIERMNADIAKLKAEAEKKALEAEAAERLALIDSDEARERQRRLLESQKTYDAEFAAAGENQRLRTAALVKFRADEARIEADFRAQTDVAVQASNALAVGLSAAANADITDADRTASQEKQQRIDEDRQHVIDGYKAGLIAREAYLDEMSKISDRERALTEGTERAKFDIVQRVGSAITEAGKNFEAQKLTQIEASTSKLQELAQADLLFTREGAAVQLDLLEQAGEQTLGALAATTGQMIEQSNVSFKGLANVATSALYDQVRREILILTPKILAISVSFLGPIAGPIASAIAIGLINLGLSAAQNATRFRHGGVVPGRDPSVGDVVPAMLTPTEYVFSPEVSAREGPLFQALHAGRTSREWVRDNLHLFVDDTGRMRTAELAASMHAHHRTMAEVRTVLSDLRDATAAVAEGQDRIARRFQSQTAHQHQFAPATVRGKDLVLIVNRSQQDELSL